MKALIRLKSHLKPGHLYRRADLCKWSNAVDRHLVLLQKNNTLEKLSGGLYYYPENSVFGPVPPSERALIEAFLKDSRYLITSSSLYNSLGVGTTQLYDETIVYNHKRHGLFKLGNRRYKFVMRHHFPKKLTPEFLLIDLIDNINRLPEDSEQILQLAKNKALEFNRRRLLSAAREYGSVHTKKILNELLNVPRK